MTVGTHDAQLNVRQGDPNDLEIEWRNVPTILVDSVVGFVTVSGIPRVTLGQITFKPGDENPRYLPQLTLAVSIEALGFMAAQFKEIADRAASMDKEAGGASV